MEEPLLLQRVFEQLYEVGYTDKENINSRDESEVARRLPDRDDAKAMERFSAASDLYYLSKGHKERYDGTPIVDPLNSATSTETYVITKMMDGELRFWAGEAKTWTKDFARAEHASREKIMSLSSRTEWWQQFGVIPVSLAQAFLSKEPT